MLIVFAGLPGVGKSTLSRELATKRAATWLRIDAIEKGMWHAGIDRAQPTGLAAYAVAWNIAQTQLPQDVIIDAVNPVEEARQGWRDLAAQTHTALRIIEVVCSDESEHRRRVEERGGDPSWDEITKWEYEPWAEPRLILDSIDEPSGNLERIDHYLAGS